MTTIAVLFLVISIVVVWGGLLASILHLRAHPTDDDAADDVDVDADAGRPGSAGAGPTGPVTRY